MFTGIKLTKKGAEMLAAAQNGGTISFTRIQIGSGSLEDGKSESSVTALVSPVGYFPITEANRKGNVVSVIFQVINKDITQEFDFREIGLFALDNSGAEHLYAYSNAGDDAETIPLPTVTAIDYIMALDLVVSSDVNVTVEIDDNLVFATKEEVNQRVKKTDVIDVEHGGTGASNAAEARRNLGVDLKTLGAAEKGHGHKLTDDNITGILPVEKGGTGADKAEKALENLGAFPRSEYMGVAEVSDVNGIVRFEAIKGSGISALMQLDPIQSGSGNPSPNNIRPFVGRTSAELVRCGENLIPYPYKDGTVKESNGITYTVNPDGSIKCVGTASDHSFYDITFEGEFNDTSRWPIYPTGLCTLSGGKDNVALVATYPTNENGGFAQIGKASQGGQAQSFYGDSSLRMRIYLQVSSGISVDTVIYPMLNLGGEALPYEPWKGNRNIFDFDRAVYGGDIDVNKGVLTINTALVEFDGSETYNGTATTGGTADLVVWVQGAFQNQMPLGDYMPGYCSHFFNERSGKNVNTVRFGSSNRTVFFYLSSADFADANAFKQYVIAQKAAGTPVQLIVPLENPITVQLIPPQIVALEGSNTVYSNADAITVRYNHDAPENIGAVRKSGDKMTGPLWAKAFTTYGSSPVIDFKDDTRKITTSFIYASPDGQLNLGGFNPDQDEKDLSKVYHELYRLPKPSAELDNHKGYDILTTKEPEKAVEALWAAIMAKIEATYNITKK